MRYTVLHVSDEEVADVIVDHPSMIEAIRMAWRLYRSPSKYRMYLRINKGWLEGFCRPVLEGRVFEAPLGREKK
jgi:hypothetical protein